MPDQRNAGAVFAAALRQERKARGWSIDRLAGQAGVSPTTVVNAERLRHGVSLDVAALLAAGLGTRVGALLGEEAGHA